MPGAGAAACQHRDVDLLLIEFFADMPTDKTAATENQNFFHSPEFSAFTGVYA